MKIIEKCVLYRIINTGDFKITIINTELFTLEFLSYLIFTDKLKKIIFTDKSK